MKKADIGLIGLAVMGENLALNIESKGFTVAVYNRHLEKVESFLEGYAAERSIIGCRSLTELIDSLAVPRKVFLMVKSGPAVDELIDRLLPLMAKGDIIIDGGNSHYTDTIRRSKYIEDRGLLFIGTGVSGGEEGALKGPSLMPGGSPDAWKYVQPVFRSICAKTDEGEPCCEWVGSNGAGHYVKMIHNGIEYGDMQLICEAYQLMKDGLGMTRQELRDVFKSWNQTELSSYLIEITGEIFAYLDENGQSPLEYIQDIAGQKGTGKWTSIAALDEGVPLTLISEAVFSRCLSAQKDERVRAAKLYPHKKPSFSGDREAFVEDIRKALYASKIISYAQGFALMRSGAKANKWELDYGSIALLWRGGCIIRSVFLKNIKEAFEHNPGLENLLLDDYFSKVITTLVPSWRNVIIKAVSMGIPMPAFSSALAYFDGYTTERLSANLLQAQRDFFGAHTYKRTDSPEGESFHTQWKREG